MTKASLQVKNRRYLVEPLGNLTPRYRRSSTTGGKFCHFKFIQYHYRAEYDHPCVVSKSRRKVAITMDEVFNDFNDWEQFEQDSRIKGLIEPTDYPKESAMYKINSEMVNKSPDQREKIKKANLNLAIASAS